MSKKPVRLDLNGQDDSMYPHPDGEWVTFAEYEAMRGQLAALVEVASRFVMESERVCSIDTTVPTAHVNALAKVLLEIQADGPTERFLTEAQAKEMAAVECDRLLESDERFGAAVEKARADGYAKGRRDTHTLMIGGEIREDYDQDGGPWECCVKANGGAECELDWGHSGPHQGHTDDGNAVYW